MSITIVQVFRMLGVEPDKKLTVEVGRSVAHLFRALTGKEPVKELREKTTGSGTHCLAVYPESWFAQIKNQIDGVTTERGKQLDMFEAAP